MPDLETIDLIGVEIMATGGPVHGVGSPPEGDYWTTEDLRAMAEAAQELEAAGEWRIAARVDGEPLGRGKLGHGKEQVLLAQSELPAAGWLSNQRVSEDGTKLLADVLEVPKKLGDLIKAKAYRTRSSELSSVTSQTTGKKYDWVVSGLAWLGGKMPAVRTLDDWIEQYADAAQRRVITYAGADLEPLRAYDTAGAIVWNPDSSLNAIRSDLQEALNPGGTDNGSQALWVQDVSPDGVALVCKGWDDEDAWVVPFTIGADGDAVPAPSSDWTQAEKAWVAATRDNAVSLRSARADIRLTMPDSKYTDEQRRKFADAIPGDTLKVEDVTDEMLANAGVAVAEAPKVEPVVNLEHDERLRKLEADTATANERATKLEKQLETERRDTWLESIFRDGKATPGQRDEIVALYEEAPVATRKFYESAAVNDDWAREYGADSEEILDDDALEAQNKAYEADAAVRLGIPAGEVL